MAETIEATSCTQGRGEKRKYDEVGGGSKDVVGRERTDIVGDATSGMKERARVERLLVVSVAITLEKLQDAGGAEVIEELIRVLHDEDFNIEMFRAMIRSREDCRVITEDVIKQSLGK